MKNGTFAIISPEGQLILSDEMYGGMHFQDIGDVAYKRLNSINHVQEFNDMVCKFSYDHYDNSDVDTYKCEKELLDMSNNYFYNWRTEYVYIKNLSDENLTMKDKNKQSLLINAGTTAVFHYGEFVADTLEDFETWSLLKEQNNNRNYAEME